MKLEKWRDITGYEGRYQVSNFGRVKRLQFSKLVKSYSGRLHNRIYSEKILKSYIDFTTDKEYVILKDAQGEFHYFSISQLVEQSFL